MKMGSGGIREKGIGKTNWRFWVMRQKIQKEDARRPGGHFIPEPNRASAWAPGRPGKSPPPATARESTEYGVPLLSITVYYVLHSMRFVLRKDNDQHH